MGIFGRTPTMSAPAEALPGRDDPVPVPAKHFVNGNPLAPPFPEGLELTLFGMGCFWGPERMFWQATGVYSTSVGYAAGFTPNPSYEEVCSGRTGHNEMVRVVFDPSQGGYESLLKIFWQNHDPTQLDRQGPDIGTQYRSAIFAHSPEQEAAARASLAELEMSDRFRTRVLTEIVEAQKMTDRTEELLAVVVRMADTFADRLDLEAPSSRPEMDPIPVRATVEFSRAVDYEDKGDVAQAVEHYRAALEIHPAHAAARAALARLESNGGER